MLSLIICLKFFSWFLTGWQWIWFLFPRTSNVTDIRSLGAKNVFQWMLLFLVLYFIFVPSRGLRRTRSDCSSILHICTIVIGKSALSCLVEPGQALFLTGQEQYCFFFFSNGLSVLPVFYLLACYWFLWCFTWERCIL